MASIVNYAKAIRNDPAIGVMNDSAYVGLTIGGVHNLGSVSSHLYQWITATYPVAFTVTQVKVDNKMASWGGLLNQATGGASHRPPVIPNTAYFAQHNHRFLLREFSAMVVMGHFIIQTDQDDFWDPNVYSGFLPRDLAWHKNNHTALSARADALQIDVNP